VSVYHADRVRIMSIGLIVFTVLSVHATGAIVNTHSRKKNVCRITKKWRKLYEED
jgi:hypothetical protein